MEVQRYRTAFSTVSDALSAPALMSLNVHGHLIQVLGKTCGPCYLNKRAMLLPS